jgi:hypothetical protein
MYAVNRTRRCVRGCAAALIAASSVALSGCATSLGENVGVTVYGDGPNVQLLWDEKHPWASEFQNSAGRFHLYGQYLSASRPVEQDLGAARVAGPQTLTFPLPSALRSTPESPICLFIARSRAEAAVPVRVPPQAGGDTARFQYVEWDAGVKAVTRAAQVTKEAQYLERTMSELQSEMSAIRADQARKQIREPADCQRAAAVAVADQRAPVDVAEPAAIPMAAQRLCIRRAKNLELYVNLDVAATIAWFSGAEQERKTDRTRAQIRKFQQHWAIWSSQVGRDYRPQVGAADENLPFVGVVIGAIRDWQAGGRTDANRATMARGVLDGYEGCLEDIPKQLRTQYEAWRRAQSNTAERDRLYAEWRVSACLTDLRTQNAAIESRAASFAEAQRRREALLASPEQAALQLPAGANRRMLNDKACSF